MIRKYRVARALVKSFTKGATIARACKAADIAQSTYFYWLHKDPKFAEMVNRAVESRITYVEDALYKNCITGSVTAQKYFLNNRKSHKWRDEPVVMNIEHKTAIFQQIHNHYSPNGNGKLKHEGHTTTESGDNARSRLQVVE